MKLLDSKLTSKDINIQIDKENQEAYDKVKKAWGPLIPIIQINDYVLDFSEIQDYELKVRINTIPQFTLQIQDTNYNIRKALKKQYIDEITVRVGNDDWYRKYDGIITNIFSEAGDENITIFGYLFVEGLYKTEQKSYKDMSINKILESICTDIDLGLYIYPNDSVEKKFHVINTDKRIIDFITMLCQKYTNNFWSIDDFGYLHIANIDSIKNNEVDTYTIKKNHTFPTPQPIVFTSRIFDDNRDPDPERVEPKLNIKHFTINTNAGQSVINNFANYNLYGSDNSSIELYQLKENKPMGIGEFSLNTFSAFMKQQNQTKELYQSMINKSINGKIIDLVMEDILLEILPFMLVDVEIYLPMFSNVEQYNTDLPDPENSGKKVIVGYSFIYKRNDESSNPYNSQTISVI